ncbi:hypothetical protein CMQ_6868 [Grosmannia clavigera kw1407]|uniref:Uncharacterized protein n=1 Tax=Grosmannia clavigera (strain kw1407 / UAMH 11150) TaxID=655863 RepID=F0X758_GROCL|nr:uncharacterized protein CMQ_6868 [Grosmannia clavigera kw1407]EFX06547.1 hypothetical protein CMQ_6868 [Grosmannia clavigera kw1407]
MQAWTAGPPPPVPQPWVWRCVKCQRDYRIGVTSRCLSCGQRFAYFNKDKNKNKNKDENKPKKLHCETDFAYQDWLRWARWRDMAEVEKTMAQDDPDRPMLFEADTAHQLYYELQQERRMRLIAGRHDCIRDCSYIGQCRTERQERLTQGEQSDDDETMEDSEPAQPVEEQTGKEGGGEGMEVEQSTDQDEHDTVAMTDAASLEAAHLLVNLGPDVNMAVSTTEDTDTDMSTVEDANGDMTVDEIVPKRFSWLRW